MCQVQGTVKNHPVGNEDARFRVPYLEIIPVLTLTVRAGETGKGGRTLGRNIQWSMLCLNCRD